MNVLESFLRAIISGVVAIVIVAGLWQGVATIYGDALVIPTLPKILARLGQLCISLSFWTDAWVSLQHLVLGYVPALIGIPIGLGLAAVAPLRVVFGGFFNGLAAAPLIAFAPLMMLWFGIGDTAKFVLVFLVAFFALASEVTTGLAQSTLPGGPPLAASAMARCIVAALRRSFLLAVTAVLVSEMLASSRGLGYLLINSTMMFDLPLTVAVLLVVALPCAIVAAAARGIERLV